MAHAGQTEGFEAEAVQTQPVLGHRGDDGRALTGGLQAADRAKPDRRFPGEIDAGAFVELPAALIVRNGAALQNGDDPQFRGQGTQFEEVGDGTALMLGDAQVRAHESERSGRASVDDEVFAHPVLRGSPVIGADVFPDAAQIVDILARGAGPTAVPLEL